MADEHVGLVGAREQLTLVELVENAPESRDVGQDQTVGVDIDDRVDVAKNDLLEFYSFIFKEDRQIDEIDDEFSC